MLNQTTLRMPGATLMTRLKVYDTPTPDGQIGGTPHLHLVCTEMYVVLSGSGAVELMNKDGFSRVELQQNESLLFSPGTIHRLINPNRDLEILVIMQNSGLPERGDNVVTFTEEWLATDSAYSEAMRISSVEDAYQRRNRGVEGFMELKSAFETSLETGQNALRKFYDYALARTANRHQEWQDIVENGAVLATNESLAQIDHLKQQDASYLWNSDHAFIANHDAPTPGFCGHLNRYFDPATLLPEGQKID